MRAITVQFSAGGIATYTAETDGAVVGFQSSGQTLLGRDSADTVTEFITPTGSRTVRGPIAYGANGEFHPLNIPVSTGENLLVSFKAAGSAIIYLDP